MTSAYGDDAARSAIRARSSACSAPTPSRINRRVGAATSSIWSPPSRVARWAEPCVLDRADSPKSPKNDVGGTTSGTPRVIDVNRWSPMTGQIRSSDRELQHVPVDRRRHTRAGVNPADPPATREALLDAALAEFAAHGFEGVDPVDRRGGRHPSAADQLPLRLQGRTVASGGRPSLRPTRRGSRPAPPRVAVGGRRAGAVRPRLASVRPGGRRAPRVEPDHGAGGHDRVRPAPLDRRASHATAVRDPDRRLAPDGSETPAEVPDIDDVVVYYSLVGAASLPYVNAPEARLLGHDTGKQAFIESHAEALVTLFLGAGR